MATGKKLRAKSPPARKRGKQSEGARESSALSSLTRLAADWYWEQDAQYRLTFMSREIADKTGIDIKSYLGKPRWARPALNLTQADWDRHRAKLDRRETFRDFELHRLSADGGSVWFSLAGEPVFDARGKFTGYRGVGRDITRQKRDEQLLRLEHATSRQFSQGASTSQSIVAALQAICESEKWEAGRYLRVDQAEGVLRFGEAWSVRNPDIERYIEAFRGFVYAPGVGLVGGAWQSGQPIWVPDLAVDPRVARPALARQTGMHGAFAVPVIVGGSTIGVLIFHSREIRKPDERLLQAINVIATQIGQLMQRSEAQDAIRESGERFRSLIELSTDFFWEQDAQYRFTRMEGRLVAGGDDQLRKHLAGRRRWETGLETEGGWPAHIATLDARQPFRDLLMWRSRPEGTRYVRVSGEPVFDARGNFIGYRGVGRDITQEKRGEQLLLLEHRIAGVLSQAEHAAAGIRAVLQSVCESANWACGRYFALDEAAGLLRFQDGWCSEPSFQQFIEESRGLTYKPGRGLAGIVLKDGEPVWTSDATKDPRVQAQTLSSLLRVHGAFAFAVASDGRAIGVLAFSSRELRLPDERLLQTTKVIGSQVGQFLQRKKAEEALRESEARFRSLTQMSSDFFWETDGQHRFTQLVHGPNYREDFGRLAIGKTAWELPSVLPAAQGWDTLQARINAREPFRDFEFGRPRADGRVVHLSISGEPRLGADGSFLGYRGVGRDITEVVLAREHIASLAYNDQLTGLANRTSLGPSFEQAVERARRRGVRIATMFLDLDGFKTLNDRYGHQAGDRFLVEVARRLRANLRASDLIARLGGDEFFVVLEDQQEIDAVESVARKVLAEIFRPFEIGPGVQASVSGSIGISIFPDDASDAATLMKHADTAMYQAKQAGKNAFCFFGGGVPDYLLTKSRTS